MFNCDPKPGKCGRSDKKSYTHTPKLTGHFVLPAVIAGCGGKQKRLYLRPLIFPKSLTTFCRFCTKCDGLCFVRAFHVFGPLRFPFCKTAFFVGRVRARVCARHCIWPRCYSIFEEMISFYLLRVFQWTNASFRRSARYLNLKFDGESKYFIRKFSARPGWEFEKSQK